MKFTVLLIGLATSFYSRPQSIYGSISSTYTFIPQTNHEPASFIVNTHNNILFPWFWREENHQFKQAFSTEISFGQLLNSHFGYEISTAYLKPISLNENNEFFLRQFKGDFVQAFVKLLINIPLDRIDIYSKIGLNIATGRLIYNQTTNSNTNNERTLNYKYFDNISLGFNASVGLNYPISKRFSIFTELKLTSQAFSPKKGEVTNCSFAGTNELNSMKDHPYWYQIDFGNENQFQFMTMNNDEEPQKLYRRSYVLGGYGFTIGAKYTLWKKKRKLLVFEHKKRPIFIDL